ncbi:DUF4013 domain-containing protein [Limnoglobus roseus]|uniref:DUF4013 domain-containing protein n=1 Tax=Limnoglobus roseus TaxID=2598579 RepID=A0A5C1AEW7_9BACT|nr:DUF4013 domain-containing protein [Limnoglobus roseus]QEL16252.1 hypothetical protein PX52LOC_03192 [Limnoglobus roseus]
MSLVPPTDVALAQSDTSEVTDDPPGVAEGLFLLHDPDWRHKVFVGGLLLMIPVVGWFATLGYRKALISRLFQGDRYPLPEWRGEVWAHIWEGLKAGAVISVQYLPLCFALAALLASRDAPFGPRLLTASVFFALFPIFSTLAFPLAVVYWAWPVGVAYLHPLEAVALLAGYGAVTFVIPAGFLQVSRRGRYAAAFRYHESLPFLVRNFRAYVLAWYRSGAMSLCGHFAGPYAPWGVVWCYLGIIYSFNRVLADELARKGELSPKSWFARLDRDRLVLKPVRRFTFLVTVPSTGDVDAGVRVGPVFAPLPKAVARLIGVGR